MTGEAAGGTEGGTGDGRPVGCGGISFCGALEGVAAFTMGPEKYFKDIFYVKLKKEFSISNEYNYIDD